MKVALDILNELDIAIDKALEENFIKAIEFALEEESLKNTCEVSLTLTDNATIKTLNAEYRNKDVETDVLSFPQYDFSSFEVAEDEMLYLGDIVISCEKAVEQAKDYNHTFEREMVYLVVHSIFHLLGYDHMEDDEKAIMREKEKKVLQRLGVFK